MRRLIPIAIAAVCIAALYIYIRAGVVPLPYYRECISQSLADTCRLWYLPSLQDILTTIKYLILGF